MRRRQKTIAALLLFVLLLAGAVLPGGVFSPAGVAAQAAPAPEATKDVPFYLQGSQTVYVTPTGKCYHSITFCGSTKTSFALSLAEACRIGYTPCGRCKAPSPLSDPEPFVFPEGSTIVYLSVGTECYHRTPDCGSLQHAVAVTLEEAEYLGRRPCKQCKPPQ